MGTYIIRRLIQSLIILIGLTIVFFLILHLTPGGPCAAYEGGGVRAAAQEQACIQRLGLDKPFIVQYVNQMSFYLHGDFGTSISGFSIGPTILSKIPATLILTGSAMIIQQLIALPLGVFAAMRQYSFFDQFFTFMTYVFLSMPTFWLGLILIFFFAVHFNWFPPGRVEDVTLPVFWSSSWWHMLGHSPGLILGDLARHLVLPVVTLAVVNIGVYSRFMRASMLDVLHMDFIRTAKAKGLNREIVIFKHAFRNALLPIITALALELAGLIGGAVITETIFSWGGIGYLFITQLTAQDYPTVQALLMIFAVSILLGNILADVTYALVDPRIRYD